MPLTSIEDASKTEIEGGENHPSETVSQQGLSISKFRDNDLDYTSMFNSLNDNPEEPFSRIGDKANFPQDDLANDPYHDDDVLQERVDNKSRTHLGSGIRGEPIRRTYEYGSYTALNRMQADSYGGLPMHNTNDYGFSMGDRHTPSTNIPSHYAHGSMPVNDPYEDGLFIETMPPALPEAYGAYGMGSGENYGEPLASPHPHSPAPFDRQRRHNSYYREEEFTPDLHRSSNNYSYSSLSYFRDGGVGVGRNFSQNHLNDDYWPRTQSVSSNMNSMGFSSYPYNRASYAGLRSSLSHSRQQISELGPTDYDMNYHIAPHRVSSMERIPDYRGLTGGFRESDIPMSRARSMMYLGEDGGMDPYYPMKTVSRENSYQNFGGLEPATLLESAEPRGVLIPTKRVSPSVLLDTENTTPITDSPVMEKTSPHPEEVPAKQEPASTSPLSNPAKSPVTKSTSPPPGKSEWRQHNSPSPTPGKSRSPRPLDEDKKHNKYKFPCRDFENGVCSRGAACKFYHDPNKAVTSPDKIPICRDYSKGKCSRDNCRFRHPGTHKDNVLMGLEQPASSTELDEIYKQYSSTLKPRNH